MCELDEVPYGELGEREVNPPQRVFKLLVGLIVVICGGDKTPEHDLEKWHPI